EFYDRAVAIAIRNRDTVHLEGLPLRRGVSDVLLGCLWLHVSDGRVGLVIGKVRRGEVAMHAQLAVDPVKFWGDHVGDERGAAIGARAWRECGHLAELGLEWLLALDVGHYAIVVGALEPKPDSDMRI